MRRGATRTSAYAIAAFTVVLAAVSGAAHADDTRVEVLFDAYVRAGRPVTVRVRPVPDRVRAEGAPWVEPAGVNGDEFVLPGVSVRGTEVTFEVERDGTVSQHRSQVRPLGARRHTAVPGGNPPLRDGEVGLTIDGLSSVAEAWRLFDAVDLRAAPALAARVRSAAEVGAQDLFLDPWREDGASAAGGIDAFRALSANAERAPTLTRDVSLALLFLAAATLLLSVLLRARREPPLRAVLWMAAPCLVALAWLLAGDRLPGALRGTSLLLDDGHAALLLVRVEAARDGTGTVGGPLSGDVTARRPTVLHIEPGDGSEEGVTLTGPGPVSLTLAKGQSRVLAFPRDPVDAAGSSPQEPPDPELAAWLRRAGRALAGRRPRAAAAVPARGLRIVPGQAWSVKPTPK